jgi:TPR repeat protein
MGTAYELCQLGCDFNPAMSMHYNALAARQGEGEAEMAISKWFLCGHEGVFEKNEQLAYEYARRAAASGLGTAEFAIGDATKNPSLVPLLTPRQGTSMRSECM